jgi:hypothetical protein
VLEIADDPIAGRIAAPKRSRDWPAVGRIDAGRDGTVRGSSSSVIVRRVCR